MSGRELRRGVGQTRGWCEEKAGVGTACGKQIESGAEGEVSGENCTTVMV
jgi:hypothetical protein